MGDCRIRIILAQTLCPQYIDVISQDQSTRWTINQNETISCDCVYSSDSTVREIIEGNKILWNILFTCHKDTRMNSDFGSSVATMSGTVPTCKLWDCTIHPPKDITSWPLQEYSELQGPKSKTLYTAGWFPSGTLLAIPYDMRPSRFMDHQNYDDFQYNIRQQIIRNNSSNIRETIKTVQYKDPTLQSNFQGVNTSNDDEKVLPSQVMASVINRFDKDKDVIDRERSEEEANAVRRKNKLLQHAKRQERNAKLDARIAKLEQQQQQQGTITCDEAKSKKEKVSGQVWKMLVKSRATGDGNLKIQDRIYFQCILLVDEDSQDGAEKPNAFKEYRYYSPQDTFAKIADSLSNKVRSKDVYVEVLIQKDAKIKDNGNDNYKSMEGTSPEQMVYRRFPVSMRVYEAIAAGYLSNENDIDTLIVRWYRDREDVSPSILQDENDDSDAETETNASQEFSQPTNLHSTTPETKFIDKHDDMIIQDIYLAQIIRTLDGISDKGKKNPKRLLSASAVKVHQMKMKSKAKGDTKRVPKIENRFYLEVVTISKTGCSTSEFLFMAKSDPLERILQYVAAIEKTSNTENWEFLIPTDDDKSYRIIPKASLTMQEAENQGIMKSFDRIIIRPAKII